MAATKDSDTESYSDLVAVPIDTFREFMTFVVEHQLWDEVTNLFQANGYSSVLLRGGQVNLLCEFVTTKGAELNKDPRRAGTLAVPRCSIIKPPPKTPMTPPKK